MIRKKKKKADTNSLLGSANKVTKTIVESNILPCDCIICGKKIPKERIAALKMLGTPITKWTHTTCSTTTKIQGIYLGEVGTSKLQLCDKIYNDSVHSMFRKSGTDDDEEEDNT